MKKIKLVIVSFIFILICNYYIIPVAYAAENVLENEENQYNEVSTLSDDTDTEIDFASNSLKNYLLSYYDSNYDNKITKYDMEQITYLEIPFLGDDEEVIDIKGIEYATSLESLTLYNSTNLKVLENLNSLESLTLNSIESEEDLKSIKNIPNIKYIKLSSIDLNKYSLSELPTKIESLRIDSCELSNIEDIKNFSNLQTLEIYGNGFPEDKLENLDAINELPKLNYLTIHNFNLTDLKFLENNNSIVDLNVAYNKIEDISTINTMKKLNLVDIAYNNLKDVSILENSPLIQFTTIQQDLTFGLGDIKKGETVEIDLPQIVKDAFDSSSSFYMEDAYMYKTKEEENGAYVSDDNSKIIVNTEKISLGDKNERFELSGNGKLSGTTIYLNYTIRANGDNNKEINFASEKLKNYLLENNDIDNDGKITEYDMTQITELYLPYLDETIDLQGLEYATSLERLYVSYAENLQVLTNLDKLEHLEVQEIFSDEDFQALNNIPNLKNLSLSSVDFNKYKLSDLPKNIEILYLNSCYIDNIEEIKEFSNLKELNIYGRQYSENELTGLNSINELSNLRNLTINNLELKNIDFLENNNYIENLNVYSNEITDISVVNTMKNLKQISISNNNIQDVSILEDSSLIDNEQINQKIVFDNLEAIQGQTLEIDLPQTVKSMFNPDSRFYAEGAYIVRDWNMTGEEGVNINVDDLKIIIDASNLNMGEKEENFTIYGDGALSGTEIKVRYNVRAPGDNKKEVSFKSESLKNYLLENYDIDNDDLITQYDMAQITELYIPYSENNEKTDLQGLEYATSLKYLSVPNGVNYEVLTGLQNLEHLEIDNIYAQEDYKAIKNIPNLKSLSLSYINMQEYALTDLPMNLTKLRLNNCDLNDISEINQFKNLESLEINGTYSNQKVIGLDVINSLTNLKNLSLTYMDLTDIEFLRNNNYLETLDVSGNDLTDISVIKTMKNLNNAYFQYNNIQDVTSLKGTKFINQDNNIAQNINFNVEGISGEQIEIDLPQTIKSALNENDEIFGIKDLRIEYSGYSNNGENKSIARISDDKTKIILDTSDIDLGSGNQYIYFYGSGILSSSSIYISYKIYADGDKTKEVEFEDEDLKNYLLQNYDIDADGKITEFDMAQIQSLSINNIYLDSVKGLGKAKNLKYLDLSINTNYDSNNKAIPVDLSEIAELKKLESLYLYGNTRNIEFLTEMKNLKILYVEIHYDNPENIHILENLTNLENLTITGEIETLEPLSNLVNLDSLTIDSSSNGIKDLAYLKKLTNLTSLTLRGNFEKWENFDEIGKLKNLVSLHIYRYDGNENLPIDYSFINELSNLWSLDIKDSYTNFDCSLIKPNNLSHLYLKVNSLLNTDQLGNLSKLYSLDIESSKLSDIEFVKNLDLDSLTLRNNYVTDLTPLENMNVNYVDLINNPINPEEYDNSRIIELYGDKLQLTEYEKTKKLEFKDKDFKEELLKQYDLNRDEEISIYEMEQIKYLSANNLEHAEYLTNLESLSISSISLDRDGQLALIEEINKLKPEVQISNSYMAINIDIGDLHQSKEEYVFNVDEEVPILKEFEDVNSRLYIGKLNLEESYIDKNIATFDGKKLSMNLDRVGEQNYYISYRIDGTYSNVSISVNWRVITDGDNSKVITFKDSNLNKKLVEYYDLDNDKKFTEYDANNIAALNIDSSEIESLEGIEKLKNLRELYASYNNISNLEPLRNMQTLEIMNLMYNDITNIEPIMGLENLNWIDVYYNKITDISCLKNRKFELTRYLGFGGNFVDFSNDSKQLEIYISELKKDVDKEGGNYIDESLVCSFASSQKYGNPADFGKEVKMNSKIKDKLIKAGADLNNDKKLTAEELYKATNSYYDDSNDEYYDAVVKSLDLSNMGLTDITGLEYLTGLKSLNLSHNNISNIKPLAYLMNLTNLDLSYNKITDISCLPYYAYNQIERTINLSHNNISDMSSINNWVITYNTYYSEWQAGEGINSRLLNLDLSYNNIEDISGVKDYKCLGKLNLSNNKIKDISSLREYDFKINEPWEDMDETDEIIELLSEFKGIDLSSNNIDVNSSGNKAVIQVFKNKKVNLNVSNQIRDLPFKDVSKNVWYYNSVKYCYENGIIVGTTDETFSPNTNVTRGNLVTILWRMEGNPVVSGNLSFPDVKQSDYYYEAVKWAEKTGVVHGYDTGKFGPNNYISREQLATILNNYAKYKKKDTSKKADLSTFTDNKKISSYAKEGVAWAVGNKVMSGKNEGTRVDPQGKATRAETAAMIQNYCSYVGR